MMRFVGIIVSLLLAAPSMAQGNEAIAAPVGVLTSVEMQQLMPASVFFQGQSTTTQLRNSFGVRFANGGLVLAGLVDTGGYSSAIRDKYQFYLLSDTSFEIGGKKLMPGAYGCGFLKGGFLVMDLGGNELFQGKTSRDAAITRPRPLQILAGNIPGEFRLYLGRDFVTLR